jgi:uncharacterized protein
MQPKQPPTLARPRTSLARLAVSLLLVAAATCATSCRSHDTFAEGQRAVQQGDAVRATATLGPLACAGDPRAQYLLGLLHDQATGGERDAAAAARWYRQAAAQGHPAAQTNLGVLYWMGDGVERSTADATAWFQQAAEQEFAPALTNLGVVHLVGIPLERDFVRAQEGDGRAASLLARVFGTDGEGAEATAVAARR